MGAKQDEYGAAPECKSSAAREIPEKTRPPAASSGTRFPLAKIRAAGMKERGKREIPEKTRLTSGIVRHDPHMRKSGSDPARD
ncbi:hypothetical protein PR048_031434 [Dryococelus australis]|uniref:Uncharacterized protein n=1 Tax=Dryococelus australis TaxID=614101 RepID=A0ABQ9G9B1_9NEOP|nr:hypothetical protein PR048_031434 [Dryococelus australis]